MKEKAMLVEINIPYYMGGRTRTLGNRERPASHVSIANFRTNRSKQAHYRVIYILNHHEVFPLLHTLSLEIGNETYQDNIKAKAQEHFTSISGQILLSRITMKR